MWLTTDKSQRVNYQRLAPALGAQVHGVDLAAVGSNRALHEELRQALVEHQVLVFPHQPIAPAELEAFARSFGTLLDHPAYPKVQGTQVQILESTEVAPSKIEAWHSDMTFRAEPPSLTVLQGKAIPEFGGDTLFASTAAAFDALSPTMQSFLTGIDAVHEFARGFQESLAEAGGQERLADAVAANPPVAHPIVRKHPVNGRRGLFVNPLFTTRIKNLMEEESDFLLNYLFEHIVKDEFRLRVSWREETVVVWDNRLLLHKPMNDFFPQFRQLHRLTVAGDAPLGAQLEVQE